MSRRAALSLVVFALYACTDDTATEPVENEQRDDAIRIVTLAPHLAEIAFAAGAGSNIVGVSAYTDYPEAAASLPVISDAFTVDQEQLRLLKPDLVLAWSSGMPTGTIEELRSTGLEVVTIDTTGLDDIADATRRIGQLTGNEETGAREADRFSEGLDTLATEYADRRPVRVFLQISARPLYTVNGQHFISELIDICGGTDVFADLGELAPAIDVEAVLAQEPEAIVSLGSANALAVWDRFETLPANLYGNRLLIEAAHLGRASTRLDTAGRELCEQLDAARQRLAD